MGAFKARVKAIVPVGPVAVTIAGHLVHHSGSLGRRPVGFLLGRRSVSAICELLFRQDSRQNFSLGRRFVVEGWNIAVGGSQLGLRKGRCENDNKSAYRAFHNDGILLQNAGILEMLTRKIILAVSRLKVMTPQSIMMLARNASIHA